MKIISRQEFLKLPSGTLFCKYIPYIFGEVEIKGESIHVAEGGDFYCKSINDFDFSDPSEFVKKCDEMQTNAASYPIELEIESRDGLHDKDQLFMIYEKTDILALITKLKKSLTSHES